MTKPRVTHDLTGLFEENSANYAAPAEVSQGYEKISLKRPLISRGFEQCNAFLLVNTGNGAALLKHVGPRSLEVFGGSRGIGEGLQDDYRLFMDHTDGHKIIVVPVYGSISYKRDHLIREIKKDGEKVGAPIEVAEPIDVPSTKWKWQIYYDPVKADLVTRHTEADSSGKIRIICVSHDIPGLDPEKFSEESAVKMSARLAERDAVAGIKSQIREHIGFSCFEELESILRAAQEKIGTEALQQILTERLDDWECQTAAAMCVSEFPRQCSGASRIPPENAVRCIDILARFDRQDDATRQKYINCLFKMADHVRDSALLESIREKSQVFIESVQDRHMTDYFSRYMNDIFPKSVSNSVNTRDGWGTVGINFHY
jgi:hypothetical protein